MFSINATRYDEENERKHFYKDFYTVEWIIIQEMSWNNFLFGRRAATDVHWVKLSLIINYFDMVQTHPLWPKKNW